MKFILAGLGNWYNDYIFIESAIIEADKSGFDGAILPDHYMWGTVPWIPRSDTNTTLETWIAIFLLALFPSFIAILFWYEAMVKEEVSRLVVFVYLIPVFAVIFSYILLGEIISILTMLFAALIIGGIALAQKDFI